MTLIRTSSTVMIDRPIEEVFEYVSHPERHHLWWSALDEVDSGGQVGNDTSVRQVWKLLGRRFKFVGSVTQREENRLFRISGTEHTDFDFRYSFEPSETGTRLTQVMEIDSRGAWGDAADTAQKILQREIDSSLAHLKDLLEAHPDLHSGLSQLTAHRHK